MKHLILGLGLLTLVVSCIAYEDTMAVDQIDESRQELVEDCALKCDDDTYQGPWDWEWVDQCPSGATCSIGGYAGDECTDADGYKYGDCEYSDAGH